MLEVGVVAHILRLQKSYRLYELIERYFAGDPIVTQLESSVFDSAVIDSKWRQKSQNPRFF